jgi:hypothetical protein
VCFIKASSTEIALKRPEFEACRTKSHRMFKQGPADAATSRNRVDIELLDPLVVQHHQRFDVTLAVSDPDLAGRKNYLLEPPAYFFFGMDGRRNRGN